MEEFCGSKLWDRNVTVDTNSPDFTPCFQQTVLVYVPCGYLWLTAPVYAYCLATTQRPPIKHTALNISKTVLTLVMLAFCMADIGEWVLAHSQGHQTFAAFIFAPVAKFLTLTLVLYFIQYGRRRGERSSGVLFVYWLLQAIASAFVFQSVVRRFVQLHEIHWPHILELVTSIVFSTLSWVQLVLSAMVDTAPKFNDLSQDSKPCPEESSTFLSRLTFGWSTNMIIQGFKHALDIQDLWALSPEDSSSHIVPSFEREWHQEILKSEKTEKTAGAYNWSQSKQTLQSNSTQTNTSSAYSEEDSWIPLTNNCKDNSVLVVEPQKKLCYTPSLVKALARTFGGLFMGSAACKLVNDVFTFVNPQLLSLLIEFISDPSEPVWKGFVYAVLMFITAILQSLSLHQYFYRCFRVGMRSRTAVISAVYKKSLKINNSVRHSATVGEITNLMAVDAQRFTDISTTINLLWSAPFQMALALYFLWQILGPSVLAGVGIMILLVPINALIAQKTRNLQVTQMKHKDGRIRLINEILNGIKVLKLYAWETFFEDRILDIRDKELQELKKSAYLNAASQFTWICAPFLVSLSTFAVYVISSPNNVLDAQKAFVALSLFNILRFPMSLLPMLIANMVQASVSVKRLQDFLSNEELDPDSVKHDMTCGPAVTIEKGSFNWYKEEQVPTLESINFQVKQGSLVAVVGSVGSGKTSLLSAMMGEMERVDGKVQLKGELAYVAQQAWIQNSTLRDNILFGKPLKQSLYYKVLDACTLTTDLQMLEAGDMTMIGEKGINLSGGQKQRVSLARAVYADADIYLLDDPLSAVDSVVGKQIFEKVIGPTGLLKNKTRIVVTHGINNLPQVDQIIVLENGMISETGSYKELLKQQGAFAEFLRNYFLEEEVFGDVTDTCYDPETASIREEMLSCIISLSSIDTIDTAGRSPRLTQSVGGTQFFREFTRRRMDSQRLASSAGGASLRSQFGRMNMQRQFSRQFSRQHSHGMERQKSVMDQPDSGRSKRRRLTRQITIADDECHPPAALMAKISQVDTLIEAETSETGSVKMTVFISYIKSVGLITSFLLIALYLLANAVSVYSNFYLSDWSNEEHTWRNGTEQEDDRYIRLGVFGALGFAQGILVLLASISFATGRVHAAYHLHHAIINTVMRAPLSFFDTTPIGRIMNRFSRDIDMIDMHIPQTMSAFIQTSLASLGSIIVISISTPLFLTVLLPLVLLYYGIQRFYVTTSRQLKRMEAVHRSPIYSHFGESIQGSLTIRAFKQQDRFIRESEQKVDENQKCYYPSTVANRWAAVRLEFVGNCIVLFAALFAVICRGSLSAGLVGLSVSYALSVTGSLNTMVRMTSELETSIIAVERVGEYTDMATEAERKTDKELPEDWPHEGAIDCSEYCLRYRPKLNLVLKGVNCNIKGTERIGIVGRSGAGKSSLTLALFRIIESAGGAIFVDGVNIADIGLHDLRSKLTIIPQEPVLFSGTLRMNLDPFNQYSDKELWNALGASSLDQFVVAQPEQLEFQCSEGGENLSVGQRQLVCLARALLRKTKILVMDEATAAIDIETDSMIQSTIRSEFKDCTVLTIAHRLNTIMDYDKIMVLDAGVVAEFDSPEILLKKPKGIFHSMARDAGLVN